MIRIEIRHCPLADAEHRYMGKRQYAHVFHYDSNKIICVAKAFYKLPYRFKMGLIIHEIGHLFGAVDELKADRLGSRIVGVKVYRENHPKYGDNLETI
jgi:hypothetical protein